MSWNPLFADIVESSVWRLPNHVRLAWIAIIAKKDYKTHVVRTNALILSDQARITKEEAQEALEVFCAPDPDSLDPRFDGKRLEKLETGGYLVLNGEKYSRIMSAEAKRQYDLEYQQARRNASKTTTNPAASEVVPNQRKAIPPSLSEVTLLCSKAGLPSSEAQRFIDYYDSVGWKVGKNPMKSVGGAFGGWAARFKERNGHAVAETHKPAVTPAEKEAEKLRILAEASR